MRPTCVAALLSALLAASAAADVPLNGAGALHVYCADGSSSSHPGLLVMRQPMTTDELATFGGTLFAAIYQSQSEPDSPGLMIVRIRIERADGSVEKIGKIRARQSETGAAEAETSYPVAVREGDAVVWRFRLRNFGDLSTNDCFLLVGATLRP